MLRANGSHSEHREESPADLRARSRAAFRMTWVDLVKSFFYPATR
jgi:hypothetical protein